MTPFVCECGKRIEIEVSAGKGKVAKYLRSAGWRLSLGVWLYPDCCKDEVESFEDGERIPSGFLE
jgi:hypothetical protein